jgi:uncharacterized membrane protein YeaQ/YmgE (transglycosylase-associated protein family)
MSIIGWIFVGLLAGWVAPMISGTDARRAWLMSIIVGILGADIVGRFNVMTVLVAILGAVVLVLLSRAVAGPGDAG